jgi:2-polyprenyl-3-methyl-5-hydroxy-6-metoxy-1,4-benzoquinol methylase
MVNYLHSLLHRPERGWDPVPEKHARDYAEEQWRRFAAAQALVAELEQRLGDLQNKRVVDLGAGPGHFSVAFALRGARVTWHDLSANYQRLAQHRAEQAGVTLTYSLGYLESACRWRAQPFDLVFNRLCWCYCMNDLSFARLIYKLLKPGAAAYIDSNTPAFDRERERRWWQYRLNEYAGIKIGHPHPPHGRIARLLQRFPHEELVLDYASELNDKIFFVKSKAAR